MNTIFKIYQTIVITIILLLVIIFLLPLVFGIKPFVVLSGSMEPEIHTGSVAYINTRVDVKDIEIGDVIGFKVSASQVTHRVVEINSDNTFTTKGDANDTVDLSQVSFDNYLGKTIGSIPYVGYVVSYAKSQNGIFVSALIVGFYILSLILEDDEEVLDEEITKKDRTSYKESKQKLNKQTNNVKTKVANTKKKEIVKNKTKIKQKKNEDRPREVEELIAKARSFNSSYINNDSLRSEYKRAYLLSQERNNDSTSKDRKKARRNRITSF